MLVNRRKPAFAAIALLILAMLACQLPQSTQSTPTQLHDTQVSRETSTAPSPSLIPTISNTPTMPPTPPPQVAEHSIAIHRIYGVAEFYNRQTKQGFIPRGVNYAVLVPVLDHYEDRLFAVGVYDHK